MKMPLQPHSIDTSSLNGRSFTPSWVPDLLVGALLLSGCVSNPIAMGSASGASTVATGGDTTGAATSTPVLVTGTAATGQAIVGGEVDLKCVAGTPKATAPTAADGSFTVDVTTATLPCVARLSYNDPASATPTRLHSLVNASGHVNITPVTDLVVAKLNGTENAGDAYDKLDASTLGSWTTDTVTKAMTAVKTYLDAQGISTTGLQADVLHDKFTPKTATGAGDAADKVLDALKLKLANTTLVAMARELLKDAATPAPAPAPAPAPGTGATTDTGAGGLKRVNNDLVNGIQATTYTWTDSKGQLRTVSLKNQSAANTGNGGYAVKMTYTDGGIPVTLGCDDQAGDGCWGYFVGHELGRTLDDGRSDQRIALLNGEGDDSPFGRLFPVTASSQSAITGASTSATHKFTTLYPKWGTVAPMADVTAATPAATNAHKKFMLPVTIQWTFENGKDSPRIDVKVDMAGVTAGQLAFDLRGPYGVMNFANGDAGATINNVQWGDSISKFTTLNDRATNLTMNTGWDWTDLNTPKRPYSAMTAISGGVTYEIGLFEYKLGTDPGLAYGGWFDDRGLNGNAIADYNGNGPAGALNSSAWPFQSANYSVSPNGAPTTGMKFGWGSANFYGSTFNAVSMGEHSGGRTAPIVALPADKKIIYRTCLVLGKTNLMAAGSATLTKLAAIAVAAPSCPAGSLLN
jgi:hypothetical protein